MPGSQDAKKRDFQPPPSSSSSSPALKKKRELAPSASMERMVFPPELGAVEKSSAEAARQWQPQASPFGKQRPVHPGSGYAPYIPQPPDHNSAAARKEMDPLHSMAAELDLAKDDDDLGPTVADCLNLGSFDDSPGQKRRRAASPPSSSSYPPYFHGYHHHQMYYNPNEQQQQRPSPPPHYYPYAASPYHHPPPSYASLPPPEQWNSTLEFPEADNFRNEPPKNQKSTTPRKAPPAAARSPFRSPVVDKNNSAKKYKRSPLFGGTPSIYGSFGMDTPGGGGTLDASEFSPMGPSFPAGFGDEAAAFPPLVVDNNQEERKRPVIRQRRDPASPFAFLGDMSPLTGNVRLDGSPGMEASSRTTRGESGYGHGSFLASPRKAAPSFPAKRGNATGKRLQPSPVKTTGGSAKQKKGWFDPMRPPAPAAGPSVRLELGDVGMKQVETRRSLDGINSMVRAASSSHGYDRPGTSSTSFRNDLATPVKRDVSSTGSKGFSGKKYKGIKTPETDKENATPKSQKRKNKCNCKKSKCLKLYCECFAAERYCNKCNCADCHNAPAHEGLRSKAIKDTRAKNPNAFKPRIAARPTPGSGPTNSPTSGHNMGCRCKRSECLKKYCECFQAGVMCGNKCKCVECLNYVGSQRLIDKRRKIKDHKGAEFAMRSADEAWKGKRPPSMHPRTLPSPAPSQQSGGRLQRMPPMIQPSPGPHHQGHQSAQHPYGMPPYPMGPPMGYSPMGMPPTVTPGYMPNNHKNSRHEPPRAGGLSAARGQFHLNQQSARPQQITPRLAATPRTPAVRLGFDPHSSRKKRKLAHGDAKEEETFPFFGPQNPVQTKTVALAVFSYLSNDDLYNAGIVSKRWSQLALDEELWQF